MSLPYLEMDKFNFVVAEPRREYSCLPASIAAKVYKETHLNSAVCVEPPGVCLTFPSDALGRVIRATLRVTNHSGRSQEVVVLPTETEYFKLDLIYQSWIAPGMHLLVRINFLPSEARNYTDRLRLWCPGADYNVMVPLRAFPCEPGDYIPTKVDFGRVPLGRRVSYELPIYSNPGKDVVFAVLVPQPNPDFRVDPARGLVKPNEKPASVSFSLCPSSFVTFVILVHVILPGLCNSHFVITFHAVCKPGMERDQLLASYHPQVSLPETTHTVPRPSPTGHRDHAVVDALLVNSTGVKAPLDSLQGVATLLGRKTETDRSPYELLGPLGRFLSEDGATRMAREEYFQEHVRTHRENNRAAMLRAVDRLGQMSSCQQQDEAKAAEVTVQPVEVEDPAPQVVAESPEVEDQTAQVVLQPEEVENLAEDVDAEPEDSETKEVLHRRAALWEEFQGLLDPGLASDWGEGSMVRQRTVRWLDPQTNTWPQQPRCSDLWFVRYQILSRFVQAGRRVILLNRLLRRLSVLQDLRAEDVHSLEST